jgi:hypothetical protein
MPRTFTCLQCGKIQPHNPRQKKQKYCSALACQNARKRLFDKKTCSTSNYKLLQKGRNKRWREQRPAHEYQKGYRLDHPEYVKRNREMQMERNNRRQKESVPMIVKTDALLLRPLYDGVYAGFKVKNGKIVKTDTLMLQMQVQTDVKAFSRLTPD